MSGTVDYPKVIDHLTDVIKELNVPCGAAAPAAPSEETRRADAVDLLRELLSTLEQGPSGAAAAAEHGAGAQKHAVGINPSLAAVLINSAKRPASQMPAAQVNPVARPPPPPPPPPVVFVAAPRPPKFQKGSHVRSKNQPATYRWRVLFEPTYETSTKTYTYYIGRGQGDDHEVSEGFLEAW
jgi:hypothetical protein